MKFETTYKPIKLFNLVSVLNIILLFFSFLMLTSYTLKSSASSVEQNKPTAKTKQPINISTIILTEHGLIFIGSEEISLPDLPERLKIESKNHNSSINLVAEKDTKVDFIQEVIDIAKSSGIGNLSIHTEMVKLNASQ